MLWAFLAASAAWLGPAVGGGRLLATRSVPACDVLAGLIGLGACGQLEDIYQQVVTGEQPGMKASGRMVRAKH